MDAPTAAVLGGLATALLGYLGIARRFSGKVKTTEASDLWKEAASIRRGLGTQLESERGRVTALEKRVDLLERGNDALFQENVSLGEKVRELSAENAALTEQVQTLNATIDRLNEQIAGLTDELEKERRRVAELEGT